MSQGRNSQTQNSRSEFINPRLEGRPKTPFVASGRPREWWLETRNFRVLPKEIRLASCCHSIERPEGESRDKTPFVAVRCAKPQQDALPLQQNAESFAKCTKNRAAGLMANRGALHNKRVREYGGEKRYRASSD